MKKAYNVYEKANIPAILRSISLVFVFGVCFLGFQTQTTAQAAYPDAVNQMDKADIKVLHTTHDLTNVVVEDALINLRNYAQPYMDREESTVEGELEQVITVMFATSLSKRLQSTTDVPAAVQASYEEVLSSTVAIEGAQRIDVQRVLNSVLNVLN